MNGYEELYAIDKTGNKLWTIRTADLSDLLKFSTLSAAHCQLILNDIMGQRRDSLNQTEGDGYAEGGVDSVTISEEELDEFVQDEGLPG